MTLSEAILSVLLQLPALRTERDEPAEERSARLSVVAAQIAGVVGNRPRGVDEVEWAAALITQAKAESGFAKYVAEGRCQDGPVGAQCDPDKRGVARARGYWQMWAVTCKKAWLAEVGSEEEVRASALCATRVMLSGYVSCTGPGKDSWQGAFIRGGGGVSCVGPRGEKRVASFRRILSSLRRAMAKPGRPS